MGKSSDPPPPPDYMAIADSEADASRNIAAQQTYANRPSQTTPWGSTNWTVGNTYDAATQQNVPTWKETTTLDPDLQRALDAQVSLMGGRSSTAAGMMGKVANTLNTPFDLNAFGAMTGLKYDPTALRQQATDAAYKHDTSRLDPEYAQQQNALEIKLRGQGMRPGDEAYDRAMAAFGREKTDAYEQARRGAFLTGQSEAGQLYEQQTGSADYANKLRAERMKEALMARGLPLNEVNALVSGQQVGMPSFNNFTNAAAGQTPDYSWAATQQRQADMDAFQADQMQSQQLYNSIMGGASLAGGFFG